MLTFHENYFTHLTAKLWLPLNHFTFYLSTQNWDVALIFVELDLLRTYNTEIIPFPSLQVAITFLFLGVGFTCASLCFSLLF